MKRWRRTIALSAVLISAAANADVTGTVTVTTDYDWRGISQTAGDPALQGSLDLNYSGFYLGVWGSNLDFGEGSDADIEVDYYMGYAGDFGDTGASWDVGVLVYSYPGETSLNWTEFHFGVSLAGFSSTFNFSDDYLAVGDNGFYWSNDYSHEWESGWSAFVHAGYSFGDAFDPPFNAGSADYWDLSAGVGYTVKNVYFEGKIVDTDLSGRWEVDDGLFVNDLRGIFSVSISIP